MKRKHLHQFLPFIILVVGGSFFIREFVSLKYKYPKVTSHDLKVETKKRGIKMTKSRTLEEEYEQIKTLDIDNWKNVRIPRPWEDPSMTDK